MLDVAPRLLPAAGVVVRRLVEQLAHLSPAAAARLAAALVALAERHPTAPAVVAARCAVEQIDARRQHRRDMQALAFSGRPRREHRRTVPFSVMQRRRGVERDPDGGWRSIRADTPRGAA